MSCNKSSSLSPQSNNAATNKIRSSFKRKSKTASSCCINERRDLPATFQRYSKSTKPITTILSVRYHWCLLLLMLMIISTNWPERFVLAKPKGLIYNRDGKFIYRSPKSRDGNIIIIEDRPQYNKQSASSSSYQPVQILSPRLGGSVDNVAPPTRDGQDPYVEFYSPIEVDAMIDAGMLVPINDAHMSPSHTVASEGSKLADSSNDVEAIEIGGSDQQGLQVVNMDDLKHLHNPAPDNHHQMMLNSDHTGRVDQSAPSSSPQQQPRPLLPIEERPQHHRPATTSANSGSFLGTSPFGRMSYQASAPWLRSSNQHSHHLPILPIPNHHLFPYHHSNSRLAMIANHRPLLFNHSPMAAIDARSMLIDRVSASQNHLRLRPLLPPNHIRTYNQQLVQSIIDNNQHQHLNSRPGMMAHATTRGNFLDPIVGHNPYHMETKMQAQRQNPMDLYKPLEHHHMMQGNQARRQQVSDLDGPHSNEKSDSWNEANGSYLESNEQHSMSSGTPSYASSDDPQQKHKHQQQQATKTYSGDKNDNIEHNEMRPDNTEQEHSEQPSGEDHGPSEGQTEEEAASSGGRFEGGKQVETKQKKTDDGANVGDAARGMDGQLAKKSDNEGTASQSQSDDNNKSYRSFTNLDPKENIDLTEEKSKKDYNEYWRQFSNQYDIVQ